MLPWTSENEDDRLTAVAREDTLSSKVRVVYDVRHVYVLFLEGPDAGFDTKYLACRTSGRFGHNLWVALVR